MNSLICLDPCFIIKKRLTWKGGKSTFDNLQTLFHRCNVRKGDKIE
ncbi:MAG: HNH endonuclease [Bacilli bacterium]|nr:HNH endonuclease [Bacilli bacterium]